MSIIEQCVSSHIESSYALQCVRNHVKSKPFSFLFKQLFSAAYKHADGKKIDGKRVLVDVERARTVKGWLSRRLGKCFCCFEFRTQINLKQFAFLCLSGGGLGGTRRGGPDVNIKHSGREDNERERERYRLEREREDRPDFRDRRNDFRDRERFNRRSRSPRIRERERERRSRSRDRKKRRSREREVEDVDRRDRDRDRRDREKEKKRKRSRSRDRDRERKRDKREKERDRDRDRERDRDRKERKPEFRDGEIKIKEEPIDGEYSLNNLYDE